jgi:transcription elongation factor Elf1
MNKPDRWELKFHDCPYCKTKQPVCYVKEHELYKKHICGSCQIGELTPIEVNSLSK